METVDLSTIKSQKVVDARGTSCPGPLLETKKAMTGLPVGAVLETLSSDEGTKADIPAWARKTGQEYLGFIAEPGYDRIFVRKLK
jgi:tRNA 2-thiouridine synthesizing protein A